MLASALTLPNHYRPNSHYQRRLSGYLYICIAVLDAKHVAISFSSPAATLEVEKLVTLLPNVTSTEFVEGVNRPSFHLQLSALIVRNVFAYFSV